ELLSGDAVRVGVDEPELQDRLLTYEVQRTLLVVGRETRQLDVDPAISRCLHERLGDAELVHPVLDAVASRLQVLARGVLFLRLESDAEATLEVQAQLEGRLVWRPRLPQVKDGRYDGRQDQDAGGGAVHATGTSTSSYTSMMSPSWMLS